MPGCILHIEGSGFDPDSFLANSTFRAYKVWRRGERVAEKGPRANRIHKRSGFRCDVSEVEGDLSRQIEDAVKFLQTHRREFERLLTIDVVDDCRLDFGYDCRLSDKIMMQGEYLPVEFLALVGQLQVAVALSLYPAMEPA